MIELGKSNIDIEYDFSKEPKASHLELFKTLADAPDNTKPLEKAFLALCTPRCGSTLFSEALNSCGRLGLCEEWFNADYFNAYSTLLGVKFSFQDYLSFVQRKTLRDTGVFCLKLHIGQLIQMNQDLHLSIEAMNFDHIVYLYRRDKIAQAVSLCKASSSDQFRSYEKPKGEARTTRHAIASCLENIIKFDTFARKYLWEYVDASYAYEDFRQLTTPQTRADTSYTRVLQALGRDNTVGPRARKSRENYCFNAGGLKKQGNAHSRLTIDDFKDYLAGEIE
jgi:LPS sulfotransferase NodH